MPQPAEAQIPVSLIASYLSAAIALSPLSSAEQIVQANTLLFTLAILLPAPLFRVVRDSALSGDLEPIFAAIIETRAAIGSPGNLTVKDAACHAGEIHSIH